MSLSEGRVSWNSESKGNLQDSKEVPETERIHEAPPQDYRNSNVIQEVDYLDLLSYR